MIEFYFFERANVDRAISFEALPHCAFGAHLILSEVHFLRRHVNKQPALDGVGSYRALYGVQLG